MLKYSHNYPYKVLNFLEINNLSEKFLKNYWYDNKPSKYVSVQKAQMYIKAQNCYLGKPFS